MDSRPQLGKTIKTLDNYIARRMLQIPVFKNLDNITPVQGMLLGFVIENTGDTFQKTLEDTFTLQRSTVSGILNTMENRGLITRERVESDARLRKIVPTESGRKIHSLIKSELSGIENTISAGLSDAEITAFLHTAEKIKRNLLQ